MTQEQFDKLDTCYFQYDINSRCSEELVDARKLLGPQRFDLYANLLYINHRIKGLKDNSYAYNVYKERTRTITAFKMSEVGNSKKNTFEDFVNVFNSLIDDTKNDKFDVDSTLIPVDKDYVLMDGAHRVASAAFFDKKVKVLRFLDIQGRHISSDHLRNGIIPESTLDAMALEACNWHDNLFMIFLWPKAHLQKEIVNKAYRLINDKSKIVYKKEHKMSYDAIRHLMIQLYGHMDWVGDVYNEFHGTYVKADEVWDANGMCSFILIQAPSCEYVLKMKSEIRDMFGIGLASTHSTDNIKETIMAANAIYNPNSMHFLHVGNPLCFKESYILIDNFKKSIIDKGKGDSIIMPAITTLAMYGIKELISLDEKFVEYSQEPIDIIMSPQHYFTFGGLKFLSLKDTQVFVKELYDQNHGESEKRSLDMISMLLNTDFGVTEKKYSNYIIYIRRFIRRWKNTYYENRKKLLVNLRLYDTLKYIKGKWF